jgi:sec-independent protein translocase protein TatA
MPELMIVFVIIILVFGTGKIANVGRDLGSAIKEFKKGIKDEEKSTQTNQTPQ